MPTLDIKHPIADLSTGTPHPAALPRSGAWYASGGNASSARPATQTVVFDLSFGSCSEAEALLRVLTTQVWGISENAPTLAGVPKTMILEPAPPTA